jgi:hypothetical protein
VGRDQDRQHGGDADRDRARGGARDQRGARHQDLTHHHEEPDVEPILGGKHREHAAADQTYQPHDTDVDGRQHRLAEPARAHEQPRPRGDRHDAEVEEKGEIDPGIPRECLQRGADPERGDQLDGADAGEEQVIDAQAGLKERALIRVEAGLASAGAPEERRLFPTSHLTHGSHGPSFLEVYRVRDAGESPARGQARRPVPESPYFFSLSMSVTRLTPRRRAVSD